MRVIAYIVDQTPPPNRILQFSLQNFSGGLNNRSEQLMENQCSDVLNMIFADDTVMEKRKGQKYHGNMNLSDTIRYIDEFKPYDDSNKLVVCTDSELYIDGEKITDVANVIDGVNQDGKYWFVDGENLYVYGKYPSEESTYLQIVGDHVDDYTLFKVTTPDSDHPKLGTEHVEGVLVTNYTENTLYYLPCENEFEDNHKAANVVPEKPKYIVSHHGRLFLSGSERDDDNVFISDVRRPHYFPSALPIQLPPNSDRIRGMAVYDNAVVVGREWDIYAIHGVTNNPNLGMQTFSRSRLNTHAGFASNRAIDVAHNYLFYLGSDGNGYFLGSTKIDETNLSTHLLTRNLDVEKEPINWQLEDLTDAVSLFYQDNWYLSVKDKVLVYSYRHRAWTMFNNFNARAFYRLGHDLIWSNNSGRLVEFSDDHLDFGLPFRATWRSKFFDMDEANNYKQFKEFFLVAHTYDDIVSDIRVMFEVDFVDVREEHNVRNMISTYGNAVWGDRFVGRNIVASLPFMLGRRGRTIRFRFTNGYFIHDMVAEYDELLTYPNRRDYQLFYVVADDAYYVYRDREFHLLEEGDLNQSMKVYQVNGDYELRGKR